MGITLFIAIIVLLALGFPVAFALAISAALAVFVGGRYPQLIVFKEMFTGIDSFPLMAVPFFILAAELMSGGALTHVLLRFAAQFEYARTVEDVLARRSRLLFLDARKAIDMAPAVAGILQEELGIDPQLPAFLALAQQYLRPEM